MARKFVLLVDFQGVSTGSLLPLTIARDLLQVMQATRAVGCRLTVGGFLMLLPCRFNVDTYLETQRSVPEGDSSHSQ